MDGEEIYSKIWNRTCYFPKSEQSGNRSTNCRPSIKAENLPLLSPRAKFSGQSASRIGGSVRYATFPQSGRLPSHPVAVAPAPFGQSGRGRVDSTGPQVLALATCRVTPVLYFIQKRNLGVSLDGQPIKRAERVGPCELAVDKRPQSSDALIEARFGGCPDSCGRAD